MRALACDLCLFVCTFVSVTNEKFVDQDGIQEVTLRLLMTLLISPLVRTEFAKLDIQTGACGLSGMRTDSGG